MPESPRNPLSCIRCKAKKIKCGREEPKCDKCTTAQTECAYPARRQKIQTAKRRGDVLTQILRRLDALEKKIGETHSQTSSPENTALNISATSLVGDDDESTDTDDTNAEDPAQYTSLIHLMNEAASNTKDMLASTLGEASPERNADALFEDALESIRSFRLKDDEADGPARKLNIPEHLALRWVESCFQIRFYAEHVGIANKKLMMAMPLIMESPDVQVHYSVIIVYYCVLFCGWRSDRDPHVDNSKDYGRLLYRECLKLLPAWKNDGLAATAMDFVGTELMTVMAIENFDYQLAWDLHLASCAIAQELKLDKLDHTDPQKRPALYEKDMDEKNNMRKKFWQLVHIQFWFRLYYDKPASMTYNFSVNFPTISASPNSMRMSDTVFFIVSSRHVFITKEFFDLLEKPSDNMEASVDSLCNQIETLMNEWNLLDSLTNVNSGERADERWMYADLLVNGYITQILMERKAFGPKIKAQPPSKRSAHAARKTLEAMNIFASFFGQEAPRFINFITFYPFVAFFTLYHHILYTLQLQSKLKDNYTVEIESDIELMEDLARFLGSLASNQEDFRMVANAVTALTKTSRHLLSTSSPKSFGMAAQTPAGSHQIRSQQPHDGKQANNDSNISQNDFTFPWNTDDESTLPQLESSLQHGNLQAPLMYVESMEHDLFSRDWHQSWWEK